MIQEFIEKWKTNPRLKIKIKIMIYFIFVIIVSIIAANGNKQGNLSNVDEEKEDQIKNESSEIINIPHKYSYEIKITIDDKEYLYSGIKDKDNEQIFKKIDNLTVKYQYQNNKYYQEKDGVYILTTKENVYDIVNYNYINLESINEYLKTSNKTENQYQVYLKDVILGNTSDSYFIINVIRKKISIDYTPLMREFNNKLNKYYVVLEYEEIE